MGLNEQKAAAYVGAISTLYVAGKPQVLYRADASATNTTLTLPTGCAGMWLDMYSSEVAFQFAFSDTGTAATLVHNTNVTIGTGAVAAGATLPAGQIHGRIIPNGATHLSLIAAASPTGKWELVLSEAPAL